MSHTPGPWTWRDWTNDADERPTTLQAVVPFEDEFSRRLWSTRSPSGQPVPIIGCHECGLETKAADKALLQAAPDLLAALKALVASLAWEEKRSGTTYAGYDDARTAIRKAEGASTVEQWAHASDKCGCWISRPHSRSCGCPCHFKPSTVRKAEGA